MYQISGSGRGAVGQSRSVLSWFREVGLTAKPSSDAKIIFHISSVTRAPSDRGDSPSILFSTSSM